MPLIGTAGHVDHGKSTLIERITGRDPDRWDEEKRRGLTIDLGFGWAELPGGTEVSFVDVPGHERYLKNMLAGIEAIDVAMFVVAADEGWMPQSEEHLAVLDLLEVGRGVVAVTKTDTVGADLVELAMLEVSEHLAGTTLERAAVVPVSARTGTGIDDLLAELARLVAQVETGDRGRPRLWVDRSFTAPGAGTVVTGTLLDGPVTVDEPATVYPHLTRARIRGLQSHEKDLTTAPPGRRVALNLSGIDVGEVRRGDMIGRPGDWELTRRVAVSLRTARYVEEMDRRGAYQMHIGTAVVQARITALADEVALIELHRPVPAVIGDRFVIRDTGRKLVVAGGRVLDPDPGPARKALATARAIDPDQPPDELATRLLLLRGSGSRERLARQTGGGLASGPSAGDVVVSPEVFERLTEDAIALVDAEHAAHPLREGLPIATLAERLGVAAEVADMIVDTSPQLSKRGPDVSLEGREIEVPADAEEDWSRARAELGRDLAVPTIAELGLDAELLHLKLRSGELVRVSQDLVMLPGQIERVREIIGQMPPEFSVAHFRDAAGLSRKYAVPLLEWADREGLTVRRGDTRTAR